MNDPRNIAIIKQDAYTWPWFSDNFAEGVVEGAGAALISFIIGELLPPRSVRLHSDAARQSSQMARQELDRAFLQHYMGEVEGMRSRVLTHAERTAENPEVGITSQLSRALDIGYDLLPRLNGLGGKALGGIMMAANLHLAALKMMAELDRSYRRTHERTMTQYAGQATSLANSARRRLEDRVDVKAIREHCELGEGCEYGVRIEYNWGQDHWSRTYRDERAARRERRERGERLTNELVTTPIQSDVNPSIAVARRWSR